MEQVQEWAKRQPRMNEPGRLGIFNDGERDFLVCPDDVWYWQHDRNAPMAIAFEKKMAKCTLVKRSASDEDVERLNTGTRK